MLTTAFIPAEEQQSRRLMVVMHGLGDMDRLAAEEEVRQCAGSGPNLTVLTGLWEIKTFYERLSIHLGPSDNPDLHMP